MSSIRDHYFTAFSWIDEEKAAAIWMRREQNYSVLSLCSQDKAWQCERVSLYCILFNCVCVCVWRNVAPNVSQLRKKVHMEGKKEREEKVILAALEKTCLPWSLSNGNLCFFPSSLCSILRPFVLSSLILSFVCVCVCVCVVISTCKKNLGQMLLDGLKCSIRPSSHRTRGTTCYAFP